MGLQNNLPTRGGGIVYAGSFFILLMWIFVALRYYIRIVHKKWFGKDDFFIGIALLFATGFDVTVMTASHLFGFRLHVYSIPDEKGPATLKAAMMCKILWTCAATFTRTSLLCFYTRLIVNTTGLRWFRWSIYVAHACNGIVGTIMLVLSIFMCNPISMYWNWDARWNFTYHNYCMDEATLAAASGALNFFMDVVVTALPMYLVSRLQMPKGQKWVVGGLLSLGVIVCIIGVVRTYYMYETLIVLDISWKSFPLWIVAMVEIFFMIFCSCAPSLQPLTRKLVSSFKSLASTTKRSHDSDSEHQHIHTYTTKNETRCRCAEIQELEDRLCNPHQYAVRDTSSRTTPYRSNRHSSEMVGSDVDV